MTKNKPVSIKFRELLFNLVNKLFYLKESSVIFCFHSVSEDGWLFSVTPANFELLVKKLLETRKIVSLEDLLNKKAEDLRNLVAITFDDGYEDSYTFAYPILKKYGLKACIFINGVEDRVSSPDHLIEKKLLSSKQIQKLKKEGWEIGFHTRSHLDLRKVGEDTLENEIIKTKNKLEKELGSRIVYFSYPFGVFNEKSVYIVQKAEYKYAFTADGGGVDIGKSPFKVGRVILDKYVKPGDLTILTSCQGLIFNKFLTSCLRIKDDYFSGHKFWRPKFI